MNQISRAGLEPEAVKTMTLQALAELKAIDITVIDVRKRASFTDFMIFASGNSSRHVNSIAGSVIQAAKQAGIPPIGVEGENVGEWVLVDLGDVIVHVMLPATREFYELEKLWSETAIDSPEN